MDLRHQPVGRDLRCGLRVRTVEIDDLRGEEISVAAKEATDRLMTRILELEASL